MKKYFFILMCFLLMIISAGCSKDDSTDDNNGYVTAVYHLLDENGHESNVFHHGDGMTFELVITNTTNHTLKYLDRNDFIDNAFLAYNTEGQIFNPILSTDFMMRSVIIKPGEQYYRQVNWPWNKVPLPAGKYYSPCILNIEELSIKTYTVDFEIK